MVVEDEKAISEFLCAKLETASYRTLAAFTGREAISLAASHCPDLVLLDLGLPDIDGMEVLAELHSWSAIPVVVVSARQDENDIVEALDKGADDYIVKPFSNSVLLARIRTALRKKTAYSGGAQNTVYLFGGGELRIDSERRLAAVRGEGVHLTPIEYKILVLLARNSGSVMTYAAIRRELWGPYQGDNRTLRVNMANLRRKIEINPADPQYILTEVGVGYRMVECDAPDGEDT